MYRLLILDGYADAAPPITDDYKVTALPVGADPEARAIAIAAADVIVGEPTLQELNHAPKLRWIQMTWAGADRYLAGGFPGNVALTTASGAFGETIAEHALAMLMALCRRIPAYARTTAWGDLGCEKPVSGSSALIFGAGDIGKNIALRLKALGAHTIGVCRGTDKPRAGFDALLTLEQAEAVLPEADFILCALPHSSETAGWLNARRIGQLRSDAVLVNVGRGSFLDTEALTAALQDGHLFGAGLDVIDPEPLPVEHPLWQLRNVILTPHVAGISFGHLTKTEQKIWEIILDNLKRFAVGEPLRNQVVIS